MLLKQAGVRAGTFHMGDFCGVSEHDGRQPHGHIHVLRGGRLTLVLEDGPGIDLDEPTLVFVPAGCPHRMTAGRDDQAQLVCAALHVDGGPLASVLARPLVIALADAPGLTGTVAGLFEEAFGDAVGRAAAADRLFELLVIQLLRHMLKQGWLGDGVWAGMGEPRLARALQAMHAQPQQDLSVAALAALAHMSRASFAAHFKAVVGRTPADYLADLRIGQAQKYLRQGAAVSLVAAQVGYDSPSALARVFRRKTGCSPRQWLAQLKRGGAADALPSLPALPVPPRHRIGD